MKLQITLIVLITLVTQVGFSGCKKETTPSEPTQQFIRPTELTIDSKPQIIATIDGEDFWLSTEYAKILQQGSIWWDIDTANNRVYHQWGRGLHFIEFPFERFIIIRGVITDTTQKKRVTEATFNSLFEIGTYEFQDSLLSVYYEDRNKKVWRSEKGKQFGNLEIVNSAPTQLGRKVLMKFDCMVYDTIDGTTSKKITNASMVLEFKR